MVDFATCCGIFNSDSSLIVGIKWTFQLKKIDIWAKMMLNQFIPIRLFYWFGNHTRRWASVNQKPGKAVTSSYKELILVVEESVPEEKQIYLLLELFKRLASRDSRSSWVERSHISSSERWLLGRSPVSSHSKETPVSSQISRAIAILGILLPVR